MNRRAFLGLVGGATVTAFADPASLLSEPKGYNEFPVLTELPDHLEVSGIEFPSGNVKQELVTLHLEEMPDSLTWNADLGCFIQEKVVMSIPRCDLSFGVGDTLQIEGWSTFNGCSRFRVTEIEYV